MNHNSIYSTPYLCLLMRDETESSLSFSLLFRSLFLLFRCWHCCTFFSNNLFFSVNVFNTFRHAWASSKHFYVSFLMSSQAFSKFYGSGLGTLTLGLGLDFSSDVCLRLVRMPLISKASWTIKPISPSTKIIEKTGDFISIIYKIKDRIYKPTYIWFLVW